MLLLGVFLFLIPALSFGTGYGWNGYPYGYNYGNQPYANYGYNYGNQLYPSYYSQPQSFGSNSNFGSISRGFQKYIYPVYYQLPRLVYHS